MIFGDENVTTGASNDFMQVSRVARQMVERFGFSKKIGQVAVGGAGGNPFLGQSVIYLNSILEFPSFSINVFISQNMFRLCLFADVIAEGLLDGNSGCG